MQTVYRLNNILDQQYGHVRFSHLSISHTWAHKGRLGLPHQSGIRQLWMWRKQQNHCWHQVEAVYTFFFFCLHSAWLQKLPLLHVICAAAGRVLSIAAAVWTVCWAEGDVNDTDSHQHQMTETPRNAPQETFGGGPQNPKTGSSQTPKNRLLTFKKKTKNLTDSKFYEVAGSAQGTFLTSMQSLLVYFFYFIMTG